MVNINEIHKHRFSVSHLESAKPSQTQNADAINHHLTPGKALTEEGIVERVLNLEEMADINKLLI